MPVESASHIGELDPSLPDGRNPRSEADNHLRLIKAAVQATFPNLNGVVNLSALVLNALPDRLTTLEGTALKKNNGTSPNRTVNVDAHRLINVATPTSAQDAATKAYAEALHGKWWPPGSIFTTVDDRNPNHAAQIGGGVWEAQSNSPEGWRRWKRIS